jgi:hypothetical protein
MPPVVKFESEQIGRKAVRNDCIGNGNPQEVLVTQQKGQSRLSLQSLLSVLICGLLIGGFTLANLLTPNPELLVSERRQPAELAALTPASLTSGRWTASFEDHAADTFVLREPLRTLRAVLMLDLMRLSDKDGLYLGKAGAGSLTKLDPAAVSLSADKIGSLAASLLQANPDISLFYTIIPDKSSYDGHQGVGFDVEQAETIMAQRLGNSGDASGAGGQDGAEGADGFGASGQDEAGAESMSEPDNQDGVGGSGGQAEAPALSYIDLSDALLAGDYYRTDLHWDQAALIREGGVLETLADGLGFVAAPPTAYELSNAGGFEGIYPGQIALPMQPDTMRYLTGEATDRLVARYLNPATGEFITGPLYDLQAFAERDPYDLFCRGAQPLVVIENPDRSQERELYVFRDSYGSSLGPLLAQGYARVTLIDLRYIDARVLDRYLTIAPGSDALFCYSTQILSSPAVLLG